LAGEERPACETQIFKTPGCETGAERLARQAGEDFVKAVQAKAELERQIQAARAKMTAGCHQSALRDHPTKVPGADDFFQMLAEKDMYYLSLGIDIMGTGPQAQTYGHYMDLAFGLGKRLDNGIRPMTGDTFDRWVETLNRRMQKQSAASPTEFLQKIVAFYQDRESPAYRRYLAARNLTEIQACGCNLTDDPAELWLAMLVIRQPWYRWPRTPEEQEASAREAYRILTDAYGADVMRRAAAAYLKAPKDANGAAPFGSGERGQYAALGWMLGETGEKAYVLNLLQPWATISPPPK
jgi:hypothetical protein